jgi:predicted transcriptional regulator
MARVPATTLELDAEIENRLLRLAEAQRRSADALVREAVEQYVEREERRERLRHDALGAWTEYQETGLPVTGDEAACKCAKIEPEISFHVLRHTWASHYGHLAPSYIVDAIRASGPRFGIKTDGMLAPIDVEDWIRSAGALDRRQRVRDWSGALPSPASSLSQHEVCACRGSGRPAVGRAADDPRGKGLGTG